MLSSATRLSSLSMGHLVECWLASHMVHPPLLPLCCAPLGLLENLHMLSLCFTASPLPPSTCTPAAWISGRSACRCRLRHPCTGGGAAGSEGRRGEVGASGEGSDGRVHRGSGVGWAHPFHSPPHSPSEIGKGVGELASPGKGPRVSLCKKPVL